MTYYRYPAADWGYLCGQGFLSAQKLVNPATVRRRTRRTAAQNDRTAVGDLNPANTKVFIGAFKNSHLALAGGRVGSQTR